MSPKIFDWGFFWENGQKAIVLAPFGPTEPEEERMITSLESAWVERLSLIYPKLPEALADVEDDWNFAFILVNPPREATVEEVEHFRNKGIELDEDW